MRIDIYQEATSAEALRGKLRFAPQPPQTVWSINVLLVEDDAIDRNLILSVLRRHPSVATASAFEAPMVALARLATGQLRPDLLLLDIHMPRVDGFGFLKRLREIPMMADVPVVFLTTSALQSDVVAAQNSSACFYLIKPDSYDELQSRLDRLIRQFTSASRRK